MEEGESLAKGILVMKIASAEVLHCFYCLFSAYNVRCFDILKIFLVGERLLILGLTNS